MIDICPCCGREAELECSCDVCGNFICRDCTDYDHNDNGNVTFCADCGCNGELEEYLANTTTEDEE